MPHRTSSSGHVLDALSLFDYLSNLFPARVSNKFSNNQKLVKILKYAVIVASALTAVNTYVVDLGQVALKSCSVGMIISESDELSTALDKWLTDNVTTKTIPSVWRASSIVFSNRFNHRFGEHKAQRKESEHEIEATEFSSYWFIYNGNLFRYESDNLEDHYFGKNRKSIMLRNIGFSKKPVLDLLQEAHRYYTENYANQMTRIWSIREGKWVPLAYRRARKLDTVDLNEDTKRRLVEDIAYYLSEEGEDNYHNRGSPYRRGYLFHGPPGTGKSSLSMAIAAHFKMEISTISLKSSGLNDSTLLQNMASTPSSSLLLLEDIDSAGIERETVDEPNETPSTHATVESAHGARGHAKAPATGKVTLSGLLNALDGAAAPEGCVLIMTTNNPDKLDPALTRPGRIDYKVAFQNADQSLARSIFRRVTRNLNEQDREKYAEVFASQIPDGVFSPAELHGFLLTRDADIPKAMEELPRWIEETLMDKDCRQKQVEEHDKKAERRAKKAKEKAEQSRSKKESEDKEVSESSKISTADTSHAETVTKLSEDAEMDNSHKPSSSSSSLSIIELSEVEPISR